MRRLPILLIVTDVCMLKFLSKNRSYTYLFELSSSDRFFKPRIQMDLEISSTLTLPKSYLVRCLLVLKLGFI